MTLRKPATPRKTPRQSRSLAMVDALLEASARILKERGYEGMSTNAVAECAGVSVGSLYQYFPNKAALLAALHGRHADQMEASINAVLSAPAEEMRDAIVNLIRAVMAAHEVDPELHRLLEKERPFFEENLERLGTRIHRHLCEFLTRHCVSTQALNVSLIAWVAMRMIESLVHAAVLEPPVDQDIKEVESTIVQAVFVFLAASVTRAG